MTPPLSVMVQEAKAAFGKNELTFVFLKRRVRNEM